MLAELNNNSQITIPPEVIQSMGYVEGDKFEIIAHENGIFLCPVVEYSPAAMAKIREIIAAEEQNAASRKTYTDVDEMFRDMGIDLGDDV